MKNVHSARYDLSTGWEVKAIAASVPPCTTSPCPTYGPETLVNQVIELRGGRAAELGLKVGDQVKISFGLQASALISKVP